MAGIGINATSGMMAAMTNMGEISNNIANMNSIGFKKTYVNFANIESGSGGGGIGVRVASIAQDFSPGQLQTTGNALDLSLNGTGFFIEHDSTTGLTNYTRAGRFDLDKNGYICGNCGRLQGYVATNGVVMSSGGLGDLQVSMSPIPAQASTVANVTLNLDSEALIPATSVFSPTDPTSYNYRTDTTLYDSLGNPNTVTMYYLKTSANNWTTQVYADDTNITPGMAPSLTFSSAGLLTSGSPITGLSFTPMTNGTANGAATLTFDMNLTGSTQFSSPNNLTQNVADGNPPGVPVGYDIGTDGVVNVYYSNGQSIASGQIAVAQFQAPQYLVPNSDMSWSSSPDAGTPLIGTGTFGVGSVELSNVDLTEELVKLMGAQHDFQANAQVQQTYSQILQTIEQL